MSIRQKKINKKDLIQKARELYGEYYDYSLSDSDCIEIIKSLTSYAKALIEIDKQENQEVENNEYKD